MITQPGVKFDVGKTRYELLPPEFLESVAQILTFGAQKYADRNWERGMDWSRAYGALMRHMWAWWGGEDLDKETGKSHLWHAGCELAFLIAWEARGMTQFDDRPVQQIKTPYVVPSSANAANLEGLLRDPRPGQIVRLEKETHDGRETGEQLQNRSVQVPAADAAPREDAQSVSWRYPR